MISSETKVVLSEGGESVDSATEEKQLLAGGGVSGGVGILGKSSRKGFTIVELLVVISIIGILAALVVSYVYNSKERTYYTRSESELRTMANALDLYRNKYNVYPDDVSRGVPSVIQEFLATNASVGSWTTGPYPTSTYDYDAWDIYNQTTGLMGGDGTDDTYQISIRFCPIGGPIAACQFPKQPWAQNFDIDSSLYYCIKGYCRSHEIQPHDYPGYCINCINHAPVKGPGE